MTTQTTIVGTPTLPRVNLLPPEIAAARVLKQYRFGAAGAVALTAVLVGAVYWNAHGGVATAQTALDASKAKTATLNIQLNTYKNVTQVKNQVQSAQATLDAALAPQILWSRYLQDMSVSLAGNYWFSSMVMTTGGGAAAAQNASPLSDGAPLGTVSLQGKAVSHYDVADLLRALAKEKGMSDKPTVQSSVQDTTTIIGDHRLVSFAVTQTVDSSGKATPATATAPSGNIAPKTPTKAAGN
ncbi:MAG: type pilus assembly protein PilN [Frankiales bacterium]|jgi:Tfp pilus assembly protein PilN|nr:type pilus assembly protein PilN [Frankiales bacterium]